MPRLIRTGGRLLRWADGVRIGLWSERSAEPLNPLFKVIALNVRPTRDNKRPGEIAGPSRISARSMKRYLAADFFELLLDDFRAADFFVPALVKRRAGTRL